MQVFDHIERYFSLDMKEFRLFNIR